MRVLAACSGGSDSVALTHVLAAAGIPLCGVAHVDHGLRPRSAVAEAALVERLAAAVGARFFALRVAVTRRRNSVEESARDERRRALLELAEAEEAMVATGHTADDQAETVLMRLARGAGTTGEAAMRPLAGRVWRPLLSVRRHELRGLCLREGWEFVDDPSNADRSFERNRIRLDVLPLLGERAVPALARAARLAAADDDLLEEVTAALAPVEARPAGEAAVPLAWLRSAPPALARRAVRRAARLAGATRLPPAARVEEAVAGVAVDMGGGLSAWPDGRLLIVRYHPPPCR